MTSFVALLTALPPDTGSAAEELSRELAHPVYAGSWWGRFQAWVVELLLIRSGRSDLSWLWWVLGGIGVLLVVVAAVFVVRMRRRPIEDPDAVGPGLFGAARSLSADEYRARAGGHERAAHHEAAALDRYRAIAAQAVEAGVVLDAPDLTAHEVGQRLAAAYPQHASAVHAAEHLFDRVRYGGGAATPDDVRRMADLDAALLGTPPIRVERVPGQAVPR